MADLAHITLPPSRIREEIVRIMLAHLVPCVTSAPAIGKSDITHSIANEHHLQLIDLRVPQCDVTDFNGLPFRNENGKAEFLPFDTFPLEGDPLPPGKAGWLLFLDELTSAPKYLQVPAYKLLLDRMVGNHKLHPKVYVVAAGNRATDKAVVHEMSTALQSRMIHLEMRVDHAEWMEWALQNDVDPRILAFLQFKPELLHKFDPDHADKTFAAPRTWWFTNKLIKGRQISLDDLGLLAGTISAGVAQEFITFVQVYNEMPKLADILANPNIVQIPHEPSMKFALATMLAEHFNSSTSEALSKFLLRLPPESRALCMRIVRFRNPNMMRDPHVQQLMQSLLALL